MTGVADASASTPRRVGAHLLGALRFDAGAYAAVAAQPRGIGDALIAVFLGAMARGIGVWPSEGWLGVWGGLGVGLLVWTVGALLIWGVTAVILRRGPAFGPLLRALGLAATPLIALAFAGLPAVGRVIWIAAHLAATLAAVLAVREAEHVSTHRAAAICLIAVSAGFVLSSTLGDAPLPAG